jgi:starch synthase (maltosyl-transferring)
VHLDLTALDLHDTFVVRDEITGDQWTWGQHNFVRLDPGVEPAHVLTVQGES